MSYQQAEASNLTKKQVSDLAESFATSLGYMPGEDLVPVIRRLGGKVQVADTLLQDPESSGSLFVEAPDNFVIVLPAHTGVSRDRFTIAHELGHYVVHYLWNNAGAGGRLMALRRGSDRVEWEANWFAAAFLMPSLKFSEQFNLVDGDIARLAAHFEVSEHAADIRAKALNLK